MRSSLRMTTVGLSVAATLCVSMPHALADTDYTHTAECVDAGTHVCAPDNPRGVPAGCYDDGGVLEMSWPCPAWTPADGWVHGDGSITYPDGPCDAGADSDRPCTVDQANK